MVPDDSSLISYIITGILGMAMSLIGYSAKKIREDVDELEDRHNRFALIVANEYPKKVDIDKRIDKLEAAINEQFKELKELLKENK